MQSLLIMPSLVVMFLILISEEPNSKLKNVRMSEQVFVCLFCSVVFIYNVPQQSIYICCKMYYEDNSQMPLKYRSKRWTLSDDGFEQ